MLLNIFQTFANCFKIPELRSRIFFTLIVLGVCRLVAIVPVPGLDGGAIASFVDQQASQGQEGGGGLLDLYSTFTGGALQNCALGSLGIMPYITATIIIQLLSAVVPRLSKLSREEGGRTKIIQYGRYLTVVLCIGQGFFMALGWENPNTMFPGIRNWFQQPETPNTLVLMDNIWLYRIQTVLFLTTGSVILMWLGEQITDRGIGNGISLVITIGILAQLPQMFTQLGYMFNPATAAGQERNLFFHGGGMVLLLVAVVAGVVAVTQAQRKIPVQYAQRSVGKKVVPGGSSFMPLRVNYAGVMPIIFAQAILMFPSTLFQNIGTSSGQEWVIELGVMLSPGHVPYIIVYAAMIIFFSYFWVATVFNEIQISDDLKKHGGYIPGVRPGRATTQFLHNTMSRVTLAGSLFLVIIAVIPHLLLEAGDVPFSVAQFFGGTSILISVGVVLDTMRQMESHLMMRHYDGFLKRRSGGRGPRLRGRF